MEQNHGIRTGRKLTYLLKTFRQVAAFITAFMVMLVSSGDFSSKAETIKDVKKSDYTFASQDYSGLDLAAKSVFYVGIYQSDNTFIGSGSGFIMFDEKLFVTNQHVINGASYLWIMDDDGKLYLLDRVVVSDKEHDIAILLFPEGQYYRALEYDAAFDQLKRGQYVMTIGSPKGLPGTVSDGIISAFPKFRDEDTRYIQITAPISHGSSGGCLLNEDLKVIGVTSLGVDEGQNLGFAIPVFIVEQLYQQWNKKDSVMLGTADSWDTVGYGIHNKISGVVGKPNAPGSANDTPEIIARSPIILHYYDPVVVNDDGSPFRIIRAFETNLGDFCADAFRNKGRADIAFINGGAIRAQINAGNLTLSDFQSVLPFENRLVVIEVTGQQVLDALEWSVHSEPAEFAGFMQVSGIAFEINGDADSPVIIGENGGYAGVDPAKPRRVYNVRVNGKTLDPGKTYSLASSDYILLNGGDSYTMFEGCKILYANGEKDFEVLIDYATHELKGVIDYRYDWPYGQQRIIYNYTAE